MKKYGTAVAVCRMKTDVLPTWSVKLVLELGPEESECLPKGNGSRDRGFRGMHQCRPCQKPSSLWTGLITIVTTLAHAECSWSHGWPFAFCSWGNSISNAQLNVELGLDQPAVVLYRSDWPAQCRELRERQDQQKQSPVFLLGSRKVCQKHPLPFPLRGLEGSHGFGVAFSFWRHTYCTQICLQCSL